MSAAAPKRARIIRFWAAAPLLCVLGCAGSSGSVPPPEPSDTPVDAEPTPSRDRPEPPPPSRSASSGRSATATLAGGVWFVVELAGQPLLERSRISLDFQGDQLSGDASCNRYAAEWARPAPGRIRIGPARSTLRACAPALMDQERRFLELLDRFETVTITTENELVLRSGSGEELRATRS